MYCGKMTKELETLYEKYKEKWNCTPDGYEELDYNKDEYEIYITDIKKALELEVEMPDLYPCDDEF